MFNDKLIKRGVYVAGVLLVASTIAIPAYNALRLEKKEVITDTALLVPSSLITTAGVARAVSTTVYIESNEESDTLRVYDFSLQGNN